MSRADHVAWRYRHGGRVRHALIDAHDHEALCGTFVLDPAWWYGTGSQDEHARCAVLPACRICVRRLGIEATS